MGNVPKRMQLTLSRRIRINLPSRKLEKMSSRNLEKMSCSEGFVDLVIKIDLKVTLLKGLRQELIGIDEQRGAVQPLIEMLQSPDVQLREMSAFALAKTLKRLEEKIQGRVLSHLLYLMRIAEKLFKDELFWLLPTFVLQRIKEQYSLITMD